ncbi:hypothetical protein KQX54_005265 [Cotesia glomerata]|uniref:Uncharacterized protein n=1 Tax=Cotesia glomerata TaxID=32391 RepID=A0AAV7HY17_COTGL|nr:hypothetical protein KQX54_005265 [Cotesia glomerata]
MAVMRHSVYFSPSIYFSFIIFKIFAQKFRIAEENQWITSKNEYPSNVPCTTAVCTGLTTEMLSRVVREQKGSAWMRRRDEKSRREQSEEILRTNERQDLALSSARTLESFVVDQSRGTETNAEPETEIEMGTD